MKGRVRERSNNVKSRNRGLPVVRHGHAADTRKVLANPGLVILSGVTGAFAYIYADSWLSPDIRYCDASLLETMLQSGSAPARSPPISAALSKSAQEAGSLRCSTASNMGNAVALDPARPELLGFLVRSLPPDTMPVESARDRAKNCSPRKQSGAEHHRNTMTFKRGTECRPGELSTRKLGIYSASDSNSD